MPNVNGKSNMFGERKTRWLKGSFLVAATKGELAYSTIIWI